MTMSRFRALVLGAAAGGGFPQWNCNCANCAAFWAGEEGVEALSQSSIAVTVDGDNWALLNASPDLRGQILANKAMHPKHGKRHSPIVSVLLTNGDLDHTAGLLTMREKQSYRLFGTGEILSVLEANPVFEALDPDFVSRLAISLDKPFDLLPGLTATLFAVPGKVPLFLEGDGPVQTDLQGEFTVGVEMQAGDERIYYIPGCARMTPDLAERIAGSDLIFFDGTLFQDDEMVQMGVGQKTGTRMGHISMSGPDGSLEAFKDIQIGRKVFLHINNTNPVLRPASPERRTVEDSGWTVARDGMEIAL